MPMTPAATRAVLLQKFSGGAKQMLCLFLLANLAAAEVWLGPGSPDAEGWQFSESLHTESSFILKKRMKMRPRLHYSTFLPRRRAVLHPHPS